MKLTRNIQNKQIELLICEEAKSKMIKYGIQDRFVIEHDILPTWFLHGQNLSLLVDILEEPGKFFINLYNELNKDNTHYRCPYSIEQFSTGILNLKDANYNDIYVFSIKMPPPEKASHCHNILLVHDETFKKRRYITEEKEEGDYFKPERFVFGEWKVTGEHVFHSIAYIPNLLEIIGADSYFSASFANYIEEMNININEYYRDQILNKLSESSKLKTEVKDYDRK